jgi:hypothetical protein
MLRLKNEIVSVICICRLALHRPSSESKVMSEHEAAVHSANFKPIQIGYPSANPGGTCRIVYWDVGG